MFQYAGPTTALRGRSPSVPATGCAKAAALNQLSSVFL
jgi:hypothetical protein